MTDSRQQFEQIYRQYIRREGADKLFEYLSKSDFFDAPASTRFHNAKAGGLCEHSVNVYLRLKQLVERERSANAQAWDKITDESIAIVGLLHDACKTDYYQVSERNVKNEFGMWEKVPYYTVNDRLPYGHGEKSVYIVGGFMRLTRDEAMAINWHMGGFDARTRGGDFSLSAAFEQYPFAVCAHIADLTATYLDEQRS